MVSKASGTDRGAVQVSEKDIPQSFTEVAMTLVGHTKWNSVLAEVQGAKTTGKSAV